MPWIGNVFCIYQLVVNFQKLRKLHDTLEFEFGSLEKKNMQRLSQKTKTNTNTNKENDKDKDKQDKDNMAKWKVTAEQATSVSKDKNWTTGLWRRLNKSYLSLWANK